MTEKNILAIFAIIFICILHLVSWNPIITEAEEIREDWDDHRDSDYHHSGCDDCDYYEKQLLRFDKLGADLWQTTVSNVVSIAFGGAITYGVGVIVEKHQRSDDDDF